MKIMLTGDYFYDSSKKEPDFEEIKGHFLKYDSIVINYEGSLHSPEKINKSTHLEMSDKSITLPENVILSLSNNHIYDFGVNGLRRSIEKLSSLSIPHFGLETRKNANDHLLICDINKTKICFVGFGWKNEECVTSTLNSIGAVDFNKRSIERTFSKINKLNCDYVIAYFHAGYEFEYFPLPLHVGLARHIVDSGADLVYSSHTHIIQPYEIYKRKMIFYGLGNFYLGSVRKICPPMSDIGIVLILSFTSKTGGYKIEVKDVIYDRSSDTTTMIDSSDFLSKHCYDFGSIESYSKKYKNIRTRKSNPRPILYYNREISNELKYLIWLFIVRLTGYLKIRQFVKKMLGWS